MKRKHSISNIQHPTPKGAANGQPSANGFHALNIECGIFLLCLSLCPIAYGAMSDATNADHSISPPSIIQESARGFYNAGTEKLRTGKWNDAEPLFTASLAKQDERLQPAALFNLGHVRFAQGNEELKKSGPAGAVTKRTRAAAVEGAEAIQKATDALASNDVHQMVEVYFTGRGIRKEMRAATEAVERAMEAHGKTLSKWRHSLDDFQSAAELNPADTNAAHNAEVVAQAIAKLVDSLKEMQQAAAGLRGKHEELNGLLKQLKGQIPAPNMPPGAPGEDGEDDDGGEQPRPESLSGLKEGDNSDGGQELNISPEKAGELLNGFQPDGRGLPLGQVDAGNPKDKDRPKRIW